MVFADEHKDNERVKADHMKNAHSSRSSRSANRFLSVLAFMLMLGFAKNAFSELPQEKARLDRGSPASPGLSSKAGGVGSFQAVADNFEAFFVRQKRVREIISFDGREVASRLMPDGAVNSNAELWQKNRTFDVESQRVGYLVIAAGVVADSNSEKAVLIDKGLKSIEWPFDRQKADGTFPSAKNEKKDKAEKSVRLLHPWSMFLQEAAHSIILIRQTAGIDQRFKDRAEALIPKLHRSALWIANSSDLDKFFEKSRVTNQVVNIALAIHEAGVLSGDAVLIEKAKALVLQSLERQTEDGTIPEKGGFDSSYQTFSMELLTRYASLTKDQALRQKILAALEKGMDKFRSSVNESGSIFNGKNTRTGACGQRVPGADPKGKNIDVVPLRLYYYGYFTDRMNIYGPLAEKILTYGQGHDHVNTCSKNGGDK